MLQVPNTDLLKASRRFPDPSTLCGQIEAHRRVHLAALREQGQQHGNGHRRLARMVQQALRRVAAKLRELMASRPALH